MVAEEVFMVVIQLETNALQLSVAEGISGVRRNDPCVERFWPECRLTRSPQERDNSIKKWKLDLGIFIFCLVICLGGLLEIVKNIEMLRNEKTPFMNLGRHDLLPPLFGVSQ